MSAKSILLIDDSDDDVFFFKHALQRKGIKYPVHVVTDGEEAITYLSGHGGFSNRTRHPLPDLIFLDIQMPGRNGHDVLQWIRQQPELKDLPVIVLSTSAHPADIQKAHAFGGNGYLIKASNAENFSNILDHTLYFWLEANQRPFRSE